MKASKIEIAELHSAVKANTGIDCANCESCVHLGSESDGNYPEMATSWPVCRRFERYEFLKPFPFKTEQKCWEPDFWASKQADAINGSDESIYAALGAFREAMSIKAAPTTQPNRCKEGSC